MRIFFDVDGVLIHGWHARPERRRRWDARLQEDLGIDPEALRRLLFQSPAPGEPPAFEACLLGRADLAEVLVPLLPRLGYAGSPQSLLDYWFQQDSHIQHDVLAVAQRLRQRGDIRLYLATQQEQRRADYLWDVLNFRSSFDDRFHSARVGLLKSDPGFFHAIDQALGGPDRSLLIDDSPSACAAAVAAGWEVCLFDGLADLTVHSTVAPLL